MDRSTNIPSNQVVNNFKYYEATKRNNIFFKISALINFLKIYQSNVDYFYISLYNITIFSFYVKVVKIQWKHMNVTVKKMSQHN